MTTFSQPSAAGSEKQCFQSLSRMSRTLLTPTKVLWFFNNLQTNIQKYFAHGPAIMFYLFMWMPEWNIMTIFQKRTVYTSCSHSLLWHPDLWSPDLLNLAIWYSVKQFFLTSGSHRHACEHVGTSPDPVAKISMSALTVLQQIQFTPPELPFLFYKVVPAELCRHDLICVSNWHNLPKVVSIRKLHNPVFNIKRSSFQHGTGRRGSTVWSNGRGEGTHKNQQIQTHTWAYPLVPGS